MSRNIENIESAIGAAKALMDAGMRADQFFVPADAVDKEIARAKNGGYVPGVRVRLKGLPGLAGTGFVVGYNETKLGLLTFKCTGDNCPVNVKRDDGYTFEYGLEQVVIVPLYSTLWPWMLGFLLKPRFAFRWYHKRVNSKRDKAAALRRGDVEARRAAYYAKREAANQSEAQT